ncbi:MAG TPA: hypothetical protein VH814_26295 [Steroidobacteraceae bacterium]|jgi:hypothetical protein
MSEVPSVVRTVLQLGLSRARASSLVPYVSRQLQHVGRTGTAGIGLLVFALAFFLGANSPLQTEVAELQARLQRVEQTRATVPTTPVLGIDTFVNGLPTRAELPVLTERIVAAAGAAGIALERGKYDVTQTRTGRLVRVRMTFPVHARYPDIRRFVDTTLATIPGAAVDGLRLEREDIGAAEIDADIRFALYLRSG